MGESPESLETDRFRVVSRQNHFCVIFLVYSLRPVKVSQPLRATKPLLNEFGGASVAKSEYITRVGLPVSVSVGLFAGCV